MPAIATQPSQITLRPYQLAALQAIADAEARGITRPCIALPTGTGRAVLCTERDAIEVALPAGAALRTAVDRSGARTPSPLAGRVGRGGGTSWTPRR